MDGNARGFVGQDLEGEIVVFEAQVERAVEATFDGDVGSGANAERLVGQELEEVVLKTKGEVLGENAVCSDRENFI